MNQTLWYNFFNSEEDAIRTFRFSFVDGKRLVTSTVKREFPFIVTCFGSYGSMFEQYGNSGRNDFYFALISGSDNLKLAIEEFNETFKNIKFRIIDTAKVYDGRTSFEGVRTYTEKGYSEIANNFDFTLKDEGTAYLLNIEFDPAYKKFAKYVARIPLGFFIRTFSSYVEPSGLMYKDGLKKGSLIEATLKNSRNNPNAAGYLISDFPVQMNLFKKLDDIKLMNELFCRPYARVKFTYSYDSLQFGGSIQPYCVYHLLENNGNPGDFGYISKNQEYLNALSEEALELYEYEPND